MQEPVTHGQLLKIRSQVKALNNVDGSAQDCNNSILREALSAVIYLSSYFFYDFFCCGYIFVLERVKGSWLN